MKRTRPLPATAHGPGAPIAAPSTLATGPCRLDRILEPEEIEDRRNLWCPDYETCLEAAYRHGWRSWTCESCARMDRAVPDRRAAAEQGFSRRRPDVDPDVGTVVPAT